MDNLKAPHYQHGEILPALARQLPSVADTVGLNIGQREDERQQQPQAERQHAQHDSEHEQGHENDGTRDSSDNVGNNPLYKVIILNMEIWKYMM